MSVLFCFVAFELLVLFLLFSSVSFFAFFWHCRLMLMIALPCRHKSAKVLPTQPRRCLSHIFVASQPSESFAIWLAACCNALCLPSLTLHRQRRAAKLRAVLTHYTSNHNNHPSRLDSHHLKQLPCVLKLVITVIIAAAIIVMTTTTTAIHSPTLHFSLLFAEPNRAVFHQYCVHADG